MWKRWNWKLGDIKTRILQSNDSWSSSATSFNIASNWTRLLQDILENFLLSLDVELFELNVHNGLSTETPVVKYLVAQVFGECPLNQSNPLGKDGRDTHLLAQAELNSPLGSYLEVFQCELFKPTP
jgi:hypothetical protein